MSDLWLYVGPWGFRVYWCGIKVGKRETVRWVQQYLDARKKAQP